MKILLAREVHKAHADLLDSIVPDAEWVIVEPDGSTVGDPEGCEIVYWSSGIDRTDPRLRTMIDRWNDPSLRWVQSPAAGFEHQIWQSLMASGVTLTNASGIHGEPIGQYVIAWILAWAQGIQGQITRSRHHEWTVVPGNDLCGSTVGIIGFGGIGSVVARIAKSIGMRVIATRRTLGDVDHVDQMFTPDKTHDLLAEADYVVLCVPGGPDTAGLIDSAAFAAMKSDAVIINIARGSIIDDTALADALVSGRIRGATLDVVDEEPLPAESPLWELPRCVITAHQSSSSHLTAGRLDQLFLRNLRCWVAGEPMYNLVESGSVG